VYINGVLAGSRSVSLVIASSAGPLLIGRDHPTGGCRFAGMIEQLEIYDQALTLQEIQSRRDFNLPPIADAGADQIIYVGNATAGNVVLNASASSDPEGHELSYTWTGSFGTLSGVSNTITLPLGIHMITLDVADEYDQKSSTVLHVAVVQGVNGTNYTQMQNLIAELNAEALVNAQTIAALNQKISQLNTLLQSLIAAFNQIQSHAQSIIDSCVQQKQTISAQLNP